MTESQPVIISVLSAVLASSVIAALITAYAARKRTTSEARQINAEAEVALSEASLKWTINKQGEIDALKTQLAAMQETHRKDLAARDARIADLERENAELKARVTDLERRIAADEKRPGGG